jgi:hypothetical protein
VTDPDKPFLFRVQSTFLPASMVIGAVVLGFMGRDIIQGEREAQLSRFQDWQEQQGADNREFQAILLAQISGVRGEQTALQSSVARVETAIAVVAATQQQQALTADVRLWTADLARENPSIKIPPFIPTEHRR